MSTSGRQRYSFRSLTANAPRDENFVKPASSASSLLSFAAAPAQGDGPDHYRPDSPDDFRVACRDVSMPLPEERSSEASSS